MDHRCRAAVLFADLDGFKAINDSAGHAVGDTVLELAAERLEHALRSNDIIARIGGDEFAILIDVADRREAHEIIRHVERVMADPFRVGDRQFTLGVTLGASFYPDDGTDAKSLLRISDTRMYRGKAAKRFPQRNR
jgi:diguanylate cyclase (GGDEF)-like protein